MPSPQVFFYFFSCPHLEKKQLHFFQTLMNTEEKKQLSQFTNPNRKKQFLASRGFLKQKLGDFLKQPASEIHLDFQPHGKPILKENTVFFNIAHTVNYIGIAISKDGNVGLDIEKKKRTPKQFQKITQKYFTEKECQFLSKQTETKQQDYFIRFWTLKEAVLKAEGRGIQGGMQNVMFHWKNTKELSFIHFLNHHSYKILHGELENHYFSIALQTKHPLFNLQNYSDYNHQTLSTNFE